MGQLPPVAFPEETPLPRIGGWAMAPLGAGAHPMASTVAAVFCGLSCNVSRDFMLDKCRSGPTEPFNEVTCLSYVEEELKLWRMALK